jgi:HSP20 family protein
VRGGGQFIEGEHTMAIKDLIPWNNKRREVGFQRATDLYPFLALHREMNRMFDDVFRGFDLAPFGPASGTLDGRDLSLVSRDC